ncbi:soluble lytic murein transglycosylase [Balnearium lithotrophicum]|uniref:Soluble lytic murein transglycosylase n=1 Tax=Balnearium lithotrophicum TaxID=223788 RepID=A0A521D837_9BACT|nr:soluble lytic murein transglycosylase [Balnearium lithotrophicum]
MNKLLIIIFLIFVLFISQSQAIEKEYARKFINSLKNKDFCSKTFLELEKTDLREVVLLLSSSSCSKEVVSNLPLPKNPYGKLEIAKALKEIGSEEKAKEIYSEIFKETNSLDEDILTENSGKIEYLFKPKVLRRKVWRAAKNREIGKALFYLDYLKDDPFYGYLLAYTLLKAGKRELSKKFFKMASDTVPESFFFLTYLSKEYPEKFFYYEKLMKSSARKSFKRLASVYILDKFFMNDFGLFRKALELSRVFPDIYNYYLARYYVFNFQCEKLKKLPQSREVRALEEACGVKHFKWKGKTDFYSLLLSPPKKFLVGRKSVFRSLKLRNKGLLELYKNNLCYVISLIDRPSPQNALAQYLCGNYKKGIKLALPFRKKINKYPYLLAVLYPKPSVFENDVYSLSIARQESLFEKRALSRSGAIGLMQIMPKTGKYIAKKLKVSSFKSSDLFDEETNYRFGSYYIHNLLREFKLFPLAAAGYNGGPSRVRRAIKLFKFPKTPKDLILLNEVFIPFSETRNYVKRTYVNLYFYSNLYGKGNEWKIFSRHQQKDSREH